MPGQRCRVGLFGGIGQVRPVPHPWASMCNTVIGCLVVENLAGLCRGSGGARLRCRGGTPGGAGGGPGRGWDVRAAKWAGSGCRGGLRKRGCDRSSVRSAAASWRRPPPPKPAARLCVSERNADNPKRLQAPGRGVSRHELQRLGGVLALLRDDRRGWRPDFISPVGLSEVNASALRRAIRQSIVVTLSTCLASTV